jgi:hypothetical protein
MILIGPEVIVLASRVFEFSFQLTRELVLEVLIEMAS